MIDGGRRLGGTVRMGSAELIGDTTVSVGGERLSADAVVIASGAWSRAVLAPLGVETPVEPQRGQIMHLRLDGVDTSAWPSVYPLSHHYIVAFDGGRLAVGATRENGVGFDARVTAQGQEQVLRDALSIAPGLADATVLETRVGLRPVSGDGVPVVGAIPGHRGLFVATGYATGGLTMGPLLGELLSRAVHGERVERLDAVAPRTRRDASLPAGAGTTLNTIW
jgi:D-amino-acid dehydrogenase